MLALGGSTNAVIHLIAMAGRAGVALSLDRFDELSRTVPVLAEHPAVREVPDAGLLRGGWPAGADGPARPARRHDGQRADGARRTWRAPRSSTTTSSARARTRCRTEAGLAILRGSLAPDGCVIKHSAASPSLLQHTGRAVVFEDYDDMNARIDDPGLDVTAESVLVLRNAGPLGAPGMPEWGMLPIPKKLLEQGVRDMVRISDARMSGTVVRHLRAARRARVVRRRAAGARPDRRRDRARRPGPPDRPARLGRRARRAPFCHGCPENAPPPADTRSSSPTTSPRPTKAATSTSCTAAGGVDEPAIH